MPKVKKEKKENISTSLPTDRHGSAKNTKSAVIKSKVKKPKTTKTVAVTAEPKKVKTKKVIKPDEQKIRIKIKAYDHRLIDECARKIVNDTIKQGATICGPIPLPTETRKWTVNRSTFVHKDARDQYEMRIFKRVIDIINPDSKIIDSLSKLDLPAGVDVEIKY
jgi:ribosomal protein S10